MRLIITLVLPQFDSPTIITRMEFGNSVLCTVLTVFFNFSSIFSTIISLADK